MALIYIAITFLHLEIVVPKTDAYKQAGNSSAVPILKAIFRQMDITKYWFDA